MKWTLGEGYENAVVRPVMIVRVMVPEEEGAVIDLLFPTKVGSDSAMLPCVGEMKYFPLGELSKLVKKRLREGTSSVLICPCCKRPHILMRSLQMDKTHKCGWAVWGRPL